MKERQEYLLSGLLYVTLCLVLYLLTGYVIFLLAIPITAFILFVIGGLIHITIKEEDNNV